MKLTIDRALLEKIDMRRPYVLAATWFGCGLLKPAPGTWGTLGGLPLALLLAAAGGWPLLLAGATLVAIAGYAAARRFERDTGTHDSGAIVIDEVAGVMLALTAAGNDPVFIGLAFLLFRVFDILKPWPVGWCDRRLPGAFGVMADDIAAGIWAALLIGGIRYVTMA